MAVYQSVRAPGTGDYQSPVSTSLGEFNMKINQPSAIGLMAVLLFAPLTVFAANPSEGCDPTGWKSGTYTMEHSGITRTFRVHVPKGYRNNVPAPLVTYFHGWGGNENEILGNKRVTSQADRRGYILVAPRGLGSGNPDQSNNSWSFSGSTDGPRLQLFVM
jgi:poly(3-hydroxybutyrate) depolymerase